MMIRPTPGTPFVTREPQLAYGSTHKLGTMGACGAADLTRVEW